MSIRSRQRRWKESGRPSKNRTPCTWCFDTKSQLKFVYPTHDDTKKFCSENCFSSFRAAEAKNSSVDSRNETRHASAKSESSSEAPESSIDDSERPSKKRSNADTRSKKRGPKKKVSKAKMRKSTCSSNTAAVDRGTSNWRATPESSPQSSDASSANHISITSTESISESRNSCAEEESASSTTPFETPSKVPPRIPPDPLCWTSENVISYIAYYYPLIDSKGDLCELFRQHEIDGKAFLLLKIDTMMEFMCIKLGPALKIFDLILKTKSRRHVVF